MANREAPRMQAYQAQGISQREYHEYRAARQQDALTAQQVVFDAKRMRKGFNRRAVDYFVCAMNHVEQRVFAKQPWQRPTLQPDITYQVHNLPPAAYRDNPTNCIATRFLRSSTNKVKCHVYSMAWMPDGRRLVTGNAQGELTLWFGSTFTFETIVTYHTSSVLAMQFTGNDQFLLTADGLGYIKYLQPNFSLVYATQAHRDSILSLSFSPNDSKFASGGSDNIVKIFDSFQAHEERQLKGHGAGVQTVAWHPYKGLIASGSKESQQPLKLWDPRTSEGLLTTLHSHKSGVMDAKWNRNGNWLLTASKDHTCKLFDIRRLQKEVCSYKAHKRDCMAVDWHPIHEKLFVSGSMDGQLMYWFADQENQEQALIERAHDQTINQISWHPFGHVLASCSNDQSTRFWTRNRLGDKFQATMGSGPPQTNLQDDTDEMAIDVTELDLSTLAPVTAPAQNVVLGSAALISTAGLPSEGNTETFPGLDPDCPPSAQDIEMDPEEVELMKTFDLLQKQRRKIELDRAFKRQKLQSRSVAAYLKRAWDAGERTAVLIGERPVATSGSIQAVEFVPGKQALLPEPDKEPLLMPPGVLPTPTPALGHGMMGGGILPTPGQPLLPVPPNPPVVVDARAGRGRGRGRGRKTTREPDASGRYNIPKSAKRS